MRVRIILFTIFLLKVCLTSVASTDLTMPIIAYWGVPEQHTSEEAFRTFSECGFTVSLFPYSSLLALTEACRQAHKFGVKIIGNCPEQTKSHHQVTQRLSREEGFFGYLIQDEPDAIQIRQQQKQIEKIRQRDDKHLFYMNLFPYYNPKWLKPSLKTDTYTEYLRIASSTSCQQLSFDYYPITTNGIRATWYYNLEMIRKESIRSGKPFWGFVLCTPHNVPYDKGNYYPQPTLASLRLQIYSNLAYGAQAIQYFTYWTPDSGEFHFHDGPIGQNGKKTRTYRLVQTMNQELRTVAKLFYNSRVTSVHHLGTLAEGTTRQNTMPTNIRSLKIEGRQGAIISQIEKEKHRYLIIVNKSHQATLTIKIKSSNDIPKFITKQLTEKPMSTTYTVPKGDLIIFKLD